MMTTDAQKNDLLEEFRHYLEQSRFDHIATTTLPDLSTLLAEMAGLKAEVKAESRQFKNTLDTLSEALSSAENHNQTLVAELAETVKQSELQKQDLLRIFLLEAVEIYDRLTSGLDALQNYRPAIGLFKQSRGKDVLFIKRLQEGQEISVRRFEQLLLRYQVRAMNCTGKMLDPTLMNAVETAQNPKFENGIVLEELRKGFLLNNQVLRQAEVKVNKLN